MGNGEQGTENRETEDENSMKDAFGREINNLRISVTDRCNYRCRYCMPEEGMQWLQRSSLLTFEEIARVARIMASLGIRKIRLTGGEPLMRKELWTLVRLLRAIPGIEDIALTTNGYFLKEQVHALVEAGLGRINVSLDSLEPSVFNGMVRREVFDRTWDGIEEAATAGLQPIKLNVVVIRGINDGELVAFAQLARERRFVVRFIEFMPLGKDDGWSMEKVVPTREIVDTIGASFPLLPVPRNGTRAPADRYVFADGRGEIGFISSVSEPFCGDCNRIRITSDGKLRTCLFSLVETDLRGLLRAGVSDAQLSTAISSAVWNKEEGHLINRPGFARPERTMSQIGG